ncbi:Protein of unknown function [Pyronema omphalodes CBS 100304]|uniref:Uncharacterized protein n=1 Tax=Pyronema omphalodes (strain CBS 100304) TaxID=1076935 RepID=U4LV54_PYROM|nr:Protein of unknown function [Pyronema omphalodes CBS 100304]
MASTLSSTDSRKTSDTQISKPPSLQDRIKNRLCKLKPPKSPKPRTSEKISSSVFPLNLPYNGSFRKLPNSQGSKWSKKCQGLVVETLHQWMEVPVKYEWQSDESMPGQVVTETVKSRWSKISKMGVMVSLELEEFTYLGGSCRVSSMRRCYWRMTCGNGG